MIPKKLIRLLLIASLLVSADGNAQEKNTSLDSIIGLKEVIVVGKNEATKKKEGEFTISVLDAKRLSTIDSDVNLMVNRSSGVKVRRDGGIGSDVTLSINGLSGNSIRYFIDGVPMESKGHDFNLGNIPSNLIDRIEIYKGVVPSYLGGDALGGAINIITTLKRKNFFTASYSLGSFNSHEFEATGRYNTSRHFYIQPLISYRKSSNNYMMKNVEVWDDESDRFILANRKRFHDKYNNFLAQIDLGLFGMQFADKLVFSASYSNINKDIQTGALQTKVYGLAERLAKSLYLGARYAKRWENFSATANASYTFSRSETVDTAYRKYSWDGTWIPSSGNEINNKSRSWREYRTPLILANATFDYKPWTNSDISFNYSFNRTTNRRSDKIDSSYEPSEDKLTKHIFALSYSSHLLDNRCLLNAFLKDYYSVNNNLGGGLSARFRFIEPLSAKASFEHSVRLPTAREFFGNGVTVISNTSLKPETSNNLNIGVFGNFDFDLHHIGYSVDGYLRYVDNFIRANVSERDGTMQYLNEDAIHVKGFDVELNYQLSDVLSANANFTLEDARNMRQFKSDGNPSATYKNRVPNRPWAYANFDAEYNIFTKRDKSSKLALNFALRWIHWYYLNWEAYGTVASKARIPSQTVSDLAMTYSFGSGRYNISVGCNNIFDALVYDNYMLQNPGRALFAKLKISIQ